jgi:hypothetical protein
MIQKPFKGYVESLICKPTGLQKVITTLKYFLEGHIYNKPARKYPLILFL